MFLNNHYDVFTDFDSAFKTIEREVQTALKEAEAKKAQRETDNVPWNVILEEDGSNTIEVAIPGKTRDDVKVKGIVKDGISYITIEVIEKETSEEEKAAQEKRKYSIHKMKSGAICKELELPSTLDVKQTSVTVADGLLTIKIPMAEEAKPIEFDIQ